VQLDAAAWLGQPLLHQFGVMILRIVEKDVDHRQQRIRCFERFQQTDRRSGVDGFGLDHARLSGFQINRAVNIEPFAAAGLLDRQLVVLGCPAADGAGSVGRMHRVPEQRGLVRSKRIQQIFVSGDERLLLFDVELGKPMTSGLWYSSPSRCNRAISPARLS
jgi:hypothetical protein